VERPGRDPDDARRGRAIACPRRIFLPAEKNIPESTLSMSKM
jgi:hypothetical protein